MKPSGPVLVTGAAGFIGRAVVQDLLAHGYPVRAMVRRTARFPENPQLTMVIADMRDAIGLATAVAGAAAIVHLAAAKSDEEDSDDVNVGGARRLVDACRKASCRRIVNISTLSAKIPRKGTYARTKSMADEVLESSGLDVTTLFPSVVYSEEPSGVFGTVLGFIRKLPVVPVLGDGTWVSAPVHVDDVAAAIRGALENDASIGKRYDVAGPDAVTFDELIDRLGDGVGRRRPKLHIPFWFSLLAARIATTLLKKPPITISNVLGSNQNTPIDIEPARRDLGLDPVPLGIGLSRVFAALRSAAPDPLHTEARIFARYLLDVDLAEELAERYAAASRRVFGTETDAGLDYVRTHPGALPFLDAADGLMKNESAIRARVTLMAAILEATPTHAEFFLKQPPAPVPLLAGLLGSGVLTAFKALIGLPLRAWVYRAS